MLLVTEETQKAFVRETGNPYSAQGLYTVKEHEQFCEEVEAYKAVSYTHLCRGSGHQCLLAGAKAGSCQAE